jgi:hypothetical protein
MIGKIGWHEWLVLQWHIASEVEAKDEAEQKEITSGGITIQRELYTLNT